MSAATACRSLAVRLTRTTSAPAAARAKAHARPNPRPAPVTTAIFPSSRMLGILSGALSSCLIPPPLVTVQLGHASPIVSSPLGGGTHGKSRSQAYGAYASLRCLCKHTVLMQAYGAYASI